MRQLLLIPILLTAACNVENDAQNDQTKITIDRDGIGNAAESLGNAAEDTANGLGRAGKAIGNEVDKIDVDVDVRRDGDGNST